jgi:plastocyanin
MARVRVIRPAASLAILAVALAGCGKEPASQADGSSRVAATSAGVHDVDMVFDGSSYHFVPRDLTIRAGDIVRFHNRSGGPHNVSFWPDSIPAGAASVLQNAMPNQMSPLVGEMVVTPDETYEISFGGAPAGIYKYYCLPHLQLGMVGVLTVES